jgi:hypothetical protein
MVNEGIQDNQEDTSVTYHTTEISQSMKASGGIKTESHIFLVTHFHNYYERMK